METVKGSKLLKKKPSSSRREMRAMNKKNYFNYKAVLLFDPVLDEVEVARRPAISLCHGHRSRSVLKGTAG
jgi:hypothetical protein